MPKTVLTVCATCADTSKPGEAGLGGGGKLRSLLQTQLVDHPFRDRIEISSIRCLMGCTRGCVITVSGRGKMQYILGDLSPELRLVEQVLDFAALYDTSVTGVTANHEWPPLMAIHFLARIPPFDPVEGDWNDDGCNL